MFQLVDSIHNLSQLHERVPSTRTSCGDYWRRALVEVGAAGGGGALCRPVAGWSHGMLVSVN
jgi:hypothetical protein